ncbi:glycosyltransferase [Desulfovibrio sp. ZJ369]|uniref:glycosyltransferase family protein n=1 Tax=Desulfovibrio sp. ZJ369 TaxID=2709793 RepID=UPI001F14A4B0|nr:glycosyltransferase [Desulfovibrio sp. ZJ369]
MPGRPAPEMREKAALPRRICLPDFAGRAVSLPEEPQAWAVAGEGEYALLLGLGPGRARDLPFLRQHARVFWLDEPLTRRRLQALRPVAERERLPANWQEISPDQAVELAPRCTRFFYRPGLRLAPEFWGPLLGRLDAALLAAGEKNRIRPGVATAAGPDIAPAKDAHNCRGPVLLPGTDRQLLHQELRRALTVCGFAPIWEHLPPEPANAHNPAHGSGASAQGGGQGAWESLWAGRKPVLLLSVNLRGLDPDGRLFYFCRALGVPVALWFVDNPWHLLSALRQPWWREAALFVTDAGFIPGLKAAGARRVFHLPLAVAPHMWQDVPEQDGEKAAGIGCGPPLFVGRSAFPERERFFAAARVPAALMAEAEALLCQPNGAGPMPDVHWWLQKLHVTLWPGHSVRCAGLGAERCALVNRVRWLRAGAPAGLRVVGDNGWQGLLPGLELLPPVDYYTVLPRLYAAAAAVLNVTSLLLPQSLSQRHFDVWAAGGLLLSDPTPGLEIFPEELTRPMTLRGPEELLPRLAELRAHPARAHALRAAWRAHLLAGHGYEHRVARICELLEIP